MDYEPPLVEVYKTLLQSSPDKTMTNVKSASSILSTVVEGSCEVPVIDLGRLNSTDHLEREDCTKEIIEAAKQWGFFQVVNHGISQQILEKLLLEEIKVFHRPFSDKSQLRSTTIHYKWGNPFASNLRQLLWSEAFHIFLPHGQANMADDQHKCLRSISEAFGRKVAALAEMLAEILSQELNIKPSYFRETCLPNTSFLRLNRYPPCSISKQVFGFLPHTDSSFLSIVYQDHVGGLQMLRDGKWLGVKPNPHALLVNIGDLFQALSNGLFRSIKHRVVAAEKEERFSAAYFYRPSNDTVIESNGTPKLYRNFTFREYIQQNEKDLKQTGDKVGLSRFLFVQQP